MSDHFDMGSQLQPGDREEEEARHNLAHDLATYIGKHPHQPTVRERIAVLTGRQFSADEMDRLTHLVEYLLTLDAYSKQQRSKAMAVKTYDSKSYELAEHFLQDDPRRLDPEMYKRACHELALRIQDAVEDWLFEERGEQ